MEDPRLTGNSNAVKTGTNYLKKLIKRTVTIDLASVATIVHAEQSVTVTGVGADETVINFYPAEALGVAAGVVYARVSAANTLVVGMVNPTAGALDAGSKTFTLITGIFG